MNKGYKYLLMLGHLCTDINQGALPAILPFLIVHHNLSYASAASLVMAANLVSSVIQPFLGYLGDKTSRPWLMSVGIVLAGAGVALIGFSQSYWFTLTAAAISGFGIALFHPEGGKLANYAAGEQKGAGISVFAVGGNLGFAIGPIIASVALAAWGLTGTAIFLLPTAIVAAIILWFTPRLKQLVPLTHKNNAPQAKQEKTDDWGSFAKVASLIFCRSIVHYGLMTFIPLYFIGRFLLTEVAANSNLTVFSLVAAVSTLVGGRIADKIGLRRMIYLCSFALAPLVFIMLQMNISLFATLLFIPIGFAMNGAYSSIIAMGQSFVPNRIGLASGILLGLAVSVGGLCAPIIGRVGDTFGLMTAMYTIMGVTVLGLLLTALLPRP